MLSRSRGCEECRCRGIVFAGERKKHSPVSRRRKRQAFWSCFPRGPRKTLCFEACRQQQKVKKASAGQNILSQACPEGRGFECNESPQRAPAGRSAAGMAESG